MEELNSDIIAEMDRNAQDIIAEVDLRAQLEQVTEECGELTQACMKLIRAIGNGNPCCISEEEALDRVVEEISDLEVASGFLLKMLENRVPYDISDKMFEIEQNKIKRWEGRLRDAKADDSGSGVAGNGCDGRDYCDIEGL